MPSKGSGNEAAPAVGLRARRSGTNSEPRPLLLQRSDFSLPGTAQEREKEMLHAAFFYVVVIALSIGTVASYFIPIP
jgi:hypothetical protein